MQLYRTRGVRNGRIEVADVLRGLAVAGIIMIHSAEQFNMYDPSYGDPLTLPCDKWVYNLMFFLFSGKMYGIFALLFGLSFFIQNDNRQQRGKDFSGRFLWRMVLLFVLGALNTAFYDGDILMSYAVYSLVLIPLSYLPSVWSWLVFGLLIIQPIEIYGLLSGWRPDLSGMGEAYAAMGTAHHGDSFLANAAANLQYGQKATWLWILMKGRHTQTIAMFILGMLLGRYRMFYDEGCHMKIWKWVFALSLVLSVAGNLAHVDKLQPAGRMLSPMLCFCMTMSIISGVTLLWYGAGWFRKLMSSFGTFGRMSLTNYFLQSIIGSFLFAEFGLGLCGKFGTTLSVLSGLAMVVIQFLFCRLWFRRHDHGPMEQIWKKLTWIGSDRKV